MSKKLSFYIMANQVEKKSLQELEAMHTGTLMNRRKALLQCNESAGLSALENGTDRIESKDSAAWQQAYQDIKQVLSQREHRPNKQERKALRQTKAKRS